MRTICAFVLIISTLGAARAQSVNIHKDRSSYKATPEKINDLVHTRLDARFDYNNAFLIGKAWLTIKPHFYPVDSLRLDAKGMEIRQVAVVKNGKNVPLKYNYADSANLYIKLDKTYTRNESYVVHIDYTARPNLWRSQGSKAITDAKGLYFVNPLGTDKNKPTQVWTQGETEATSVWIPTIDRPNQKTTQEFNLTVPAKYVSLSNGKMVAQKTNGDGTRTDSWKMEHPHAPYLFFMGIGDYAVVKDSYKGKEVSYYVEQPYAGVARKIFGNTPEMMRYFSDLLGVEYPWSKYAQMTARDYVSGAMENTTATLHQESAQQDARELVDENRWEDVISHELFHHWFGDLVTTESWSNLAMNESFADYSEYLWREYKYGKDAADAHAYEALQTYLSNPGESAKELVRFHYRDKEDMFDAVSYQKGGRILHMLRNYVGDSAFFKSLNLYLNQNKFGTGEAHQLRLAFEEVTGKDLNWFFNQWFFGAGHPTLDIKYDYDEQRKVASVYIKQTQKGDKQFQLPLAIDVYEGAAKKRYNVWLTKSDTFSFPVNSKPSLINVDGDKVMLAVKKEGKSIAEYVHQYRHAAKYEDRREAIAFASKNKRSTEAQSLLVEALGDKYHELRRMALAGIDSSVSADVLKKVEGMAKNDVSRLVRADAILFLGNQANNSYRSLFMTGLKDSSYSVAGASLEALFGIDKMAAVNEAKQLAGQPSKGRLKAAITNVLIASGDEAASEVVLNNFESMGMQEKFSMLEQFGQFVGSLENTVQFKRGVDAIVNSAAGLPEQYRTQLDFYINNIILVNISSRKEAEIKANMGNVAELQKQVEYVKSKRNK